jgi:ariadne-1
MLLIQFVSPQMMSGLECGHVYCTLCLTEYVTAKIMDEGASQMIECPGTCEVLIDDVTIMNLIKESEVKQKYQHLIANSVVQVCTANQRVITFKTKF